MYNLYGNQKTPNSQSNIEKEEIEIGGNELAVGVLNALGGKDNLVSLDVCITRLRVEVK